jgi:hypothetical protein
MEPHHRSTSAEPFLVLENVAIIACVVGRRHRHRDAREGELGDESDFNTSPLQQLATSDDHKHVEPSTAHFILFLYYIYNKTKQFQCFVI